jgi:methionine-rich copper-binding protein CopC
MSLVCRVFLLIFAVCLVPALGQTATAHALVVESAPAADGSVAGPDIEISLRFNSRLDQKRSQLTLVDPDNANHGLAVSPASAPDMLQAKASGLRPGAYKLRWQVLAIDGHITRGDIPFRVTQP